MAHQFAFVDEIKVSDFKMVAVVMEATTMPSIRRELQGLRLRGQRRIHMRRESLQRKTTLLSKVSKFNFVVVVTSSSKKSEAEARQEALGNLIDELILLRVRHIEIERDESFEKFDNVLIANKLRLSHAGIVPTYRHLSPWEEPLLWLADIVAWGVENRAEQLIRQVSSKNPD